MVTMTGSHEVARVTGFMPLTDRLVSMTWVKQANSSLLLLSLASGTLMGLLPDLSQFPEGDPSGCFAFHSRLVLQQLCCSSQSTLLVPVLQQL